mmetsp:Transcript_25227/g.74158  ORF Transcript_25227/g.74158 Transcript_25227/m.74158 type:complete len:265 (+) Transcript_25227:1835-2629(+)
MEGDYGIQEGPGRRGERRPEGGGGAQDEDRARDARGVRGHGERQAHLAAQSAGGVRGGISRILQGSLPRQLRRSSKVHPLLHGGADRMPIGIVHTRHAPVRVVQGYVRRERPEHSPVRQEGLHQRRVRRYHAPVAQVRQGRGRFGRSSPQRLPRDPSKVQGAQHHQQAPRPKIPRHDPRHRRGEGRKGGGGGGEGRRIRSILEQFRQISQGRGGGGRSSSEGHRPPPPFLLVELRGRIHLPRFVRRGHEGRTEIHLLRHGGREG